MVPGGGGGRGGGEKKLRTKEKKTKKSKTEVFFVIHVYVLKFAITTKTNGNVTIINNAVYCY